jgi:hypothetical protein
MVSVSWRGIEVDLHSRPIPPLMSSRISKKGLSLKKTWGPDAVSHLMPLCGEETYGQAPAASDTRSIPPSPHSRWSCCSRWRWA